MTTYGVTAQGFVSKQQATIIAEMQESFRQAFGQNLNFGAQSVLGQAIGIFSEREALLWQLAEAVYSSQFPGGAEGTAVDNILALNKLQRLAATATRTNPEPLTRADKVTLYGLVLFGTGGTVVPAGSLISDGASPPVVFALDTAATILPAVNAQQQLVRSNMPNAGSFALSLTAPSGNTVTTTAMAYNAQAQVTGIAWPVQPISGTYRLSLSTITGAQITAPITVGSTAATVQIALQALPGYSGVTVGGSQAAGFTVGFPAGPMPKLTANATRLTFGLPPTFGAYTLALNGTQTASLPFNTTAAQMQAAVRALAGYEVVNVVGDSTLGFSFIWNHLTPPTLTVAANSTSQSATVTLTYGLNQPVVVTNAVQAEINTLYDVPSLSLPFTDVQVSTAAVGFNLLFGALTPIAGMPASGAKPQPIGIIASNSLFFGGIATNLQILNTTVGARAQAVASATATQTGPNFVAANTLTTILSPIGGWTGVTNQLDALTGANLESDTEALQRRLTLLSANANGPLQSIVEKVLQVTGVTAAIGFQNLTNAAVQRLFFSVTPTTGSFRLIVGGSLTASIAYNAAASVVQAAINAIAGYEAVMVKGALTASTGISIDFNGAIGGQVQNLILVVSNTTDAAITTDYGRPPHAFEIVVQNGDGLSIAEAILGACPAGIASYSQPALITTGSTTAASAAMTIAGGIASVAIGQNITGPGLQVGTQVAAIGVGNTLTMSLPALSTQAGGRIVFDYGQLLKDRYGNQQLIRYSRPVPVPIYISVTMVTDTYRIPGNTGSGFNGDALFNPQSIADIQQDLIDIANAVPISGLIVAQGTNGLIGAFNDVPGIISYDLKFGRTPNPSQAINLQLGEEEIASAQTFLVAVSYT